ncbi:hypothetical protein AaE_008580 [Aphanomyces astaci]|uniref:Uncharacterized protein n=1 Tax=Aphanomyces astaci TaxID=112090 RepID=A0A6A4ZZI1_APHAT|nr:hypothetical protein AaE_008580 [Aphanomyces astaci]
MQRFRNYFYRQWLPPLLNNDQVAIGSRFWKWQIFHSAQGTALTNNPNEQYNATIKTVLKRPKLHIPHLLQTFATLLRNESERNATIALAPKVNERLRRHYAMFMKQGRLRLRSAGPAFLGLWNVTHLARAHDADDDDEEEYFRRDVDPSNSKMRINRNLRRLESKHQPETGWVVNPDVASCVCGY